MNDFARRWTANANLSFSIASLLAVSAVCWLFLSQLFIIKDVNPEAMDITLTVGHLERAREQGLLARTYWETEPSLQNMKQENPQWAFAYPRQRFHLEFFALQAPLLAALYTPIVKAVSVSFKTVAIYSTLFSLLTLFGMGWLAWRMFGRWAGICAMVLLSTSLSWLIHTKVGYAAWMPSSLLMMCVGASSWAYLKSNGRVPVIVMGVLLGLAYLVGWIVIVFASLAFGLTIAIGCRSGFRRMLVDGGLALGAAMATAIAFTFAYGIYFGCGFLEIHSAIYDTMFYRFSQGSVPGQDLTISGRMAYAFQCLFRDMLMVDHVDKVLEGHPAISPLFSVLFGIGLLYCIKERSLADKALLIWLMSVFAVFGCLYTFAHRYALLVLPAMSIIAARGVAGIADDLVHWRGLGMGKAFACALAILLGLTVLQTHHNFYQRYMQEKPPNFEVDRLRGHKAFSEWLKQTGSPEDTVVVMGDSTMFPHTSFLFNTFGQHWRFLYWTNYFRTGAGAQEVLEFEKQLLSERRRIVFAFPTQLIAEPEPDVFMNDWRPFATAHPGLKPSWSYAYAGRHPSIVVFEVKRAGVE